MYDENDALPTVEIASMARLRLVNIESALVPPLVTAIDQAEELLGAGVVESLEHLQAARIEVLARLALRFEVGDRAREIRIRRMARVPAAAALAELLGPAVLDRLVTGSAIWHLEVLAGMIAEGRDA